MSCFAHFAKAVLALVPALDPGLIVGKQRSRPAVNGPAQFTRRFRNALACAWLAEHANARHGLPDRLLLWSRGRGGLHVRRQRPRSSVSERAAVPISLHGQPWPNRKPLPARSGAVSGQVPQNPLAARRPASRVAPQSPRLHTATGSSGQSARLMQFPFSLCDVSHFSGLGVERTVRSRHGGTLQCRFTGSD